MLRNNKSLGDLIRYYRIMQNYSQSDLAQRLKVTVAAVSNWERGISKPGVDVAILLTEEMNMTLDEFYTLKKIPSNKQKVSMNDRITFTHAYIWFVDYKFNSENELNLRLGLQGLSLIESMIQEDISIHIETKDHIIKPFQRKIFEKSPQISTMSPELSNFPISAKSYELTAHFKVDYRNDLKLVIKMQEEDAEIVFSECFNDLMVHGISLKENQEEMVKRLQSDDFVDFLRFISKTRGFSYIRNYFLKKFMEIYTQE